MSGHSKWATIHRQKETTDQKRGQEFTKISNAIIVAVRESGGVADPESNFKLRLAIEKARGINMPKDNIQRAIDRATGKAEGGEIEEITYEGYSLGGVGILVEVATDNKQRTVQEIKNIFDKNGGSIASPGSVAFNFKKVGFLVVDINGTPLDEAVLKMIDFGAEDVEETEDKTLEIYVELDKLSDIKEKISAVPFNIKSTEIIQKPVNLVPISDENTARKILNFMDKLESLDDVQKVFANFDIPEDILKKADQL